MWEQLNSDRIFDKKHKPTEIQIWFKEFKILNRKKALRYFILMVKIAIFTIKTPSFNPEKVFLVLY